MEIYYKKNNTGLTEFIAFYEKKLSDYMDPFRRCRAGNFSADALWCYAKEAFEGFLEDEKTNKLDELLAQTNLLLDDYYRQTTKDFAIAPDIFAHRNEVEGELRRLKTKLLQQN